MVRKKGEKGEIWRDTNTHPQSPHTHSNPLPFEDGSNSDDSNVEDDDDLYDYQNMEKHLTLRLKVGLLKTSIKALMMKKILSFVAKLEDQLEIVTRTWEEYREKARKEYGDYTQERIERGLDLAVSNVKLWYEASIDFTGVHVQVQSPDSIAIVRLMDFVLLLGNESSRGQQGSLLSQQKNYRDFNITITLSEISAWLLRSDVKYTVTEKGLVFTDQGGMVYGGLSGTPQASGILFGFMTHLQVSNFYAFNQSKSGWYGKKSWEDRTSSEEEEGEGKPISLTDLLQSAWIQIANTAIVMQPAALVSGAHLVNYYLKAIRDFRNGMDRLVSESLSLRESRDTARKIVQGKTSFTLFYKRKKKPTPHSLLLLCRLEVEQRLKECSARR